MEILIQFDGGLIFTAVIQNSILGRVTSLWKGRVV